LTIRDRRKPAESDVVTVTPQAKQFISLPAQYPRTAGQAGRLSFQGMDHNLTPILDGWVHHHSALVD
jgi:hypothetical protein